MGSNRESKFVPFSLQFEGNITITGIKYIPRAPYVLSRYRPLLIFLHGGSFTAHNFDIAPGPLTASTPADLFSIPVVSINRPGYLGSTPLRVPDDSTYHKTLGNFNHKHLFPALWREFGQSNQCTALVPMVHSLGTPGTLIAAALTAQESKPSYPLAGVIFSGWGDMSHSIRTNFGTPGMSPEEMLVWKKDIMLGSSEHRNAPPEAVAAMQAQSHTYDPAEAMEWIDGTWSSYCEEHQEQVAVPIMFGLGEYDMFFQATREHLKAYERMFPKCPRFDSSLVLGAGHGIEWGYAAMGWYARCFGFAIEVCEMFGTNQSDKNVG